MRYLIGLILVLMLASCQLLEINIVQRSVMESGESLNSSSLDTDKETTDMELIVPIR